MTAKQRAFLRAYAKSASVTEAAKASKIGRRAHYDWIHEAEYKAAYDDAREQACEALETIARKRATRAKKPSDLLLIFLMKGAMPEKYRDNARLEHTGAGGAPLEVRVVFVTPPEPPDDSAG